MQVCPKCGYVTMDNNDKYCPNCIYKAEYENVDDVSKGLKEMYEEDLVWSFSEIAIDAIFKETDLKQYCVSQFPAHKHLYEINYNNQNMMEYFRILYRKNSITEFMKIGIESVRKFKEQGV